MRKDISAGNSTKQENKKNFGRGGLQKDVWTQRREKCLRKWSGNGIKIWYLQKKEAVVNCMAYDERNIGRICRLIWE